MEFTDLVGKEVDFYGVDNNRFKLNTTVFEAIEDAEDGYRSYLRSKEVPEGEGVFFKQPLARVKVESADDFSGFQLRDVVDGHIWLEVGTAAFDMWYPYFVLYYEPKRKESLTQSME